MISRLNVDHVDITDDRMLLRLRPVGDGSGLAPLHKSAAAFNGQRGITVEHGRVFLPADTSGVRLILPRKTRPFRSARVAPGVYNDMTAS
ncbi:hypothetical protein CA951_40320 [Rhodococcus sp. NCIMB 12038]|nr:hypothetical protein CA951_40320 [Rhodococcus sp. NCIMB 12038]